MTELDKAQYAWAVFMLVWGVLLIGSIDNFPRPLFMQGASMNTVVVFFSHTVSGEK